VIFARPLTLLIVLLLSLAVSACDAGVAPRETAMPSPAPATQTVEPAYTVALPTQTQTTEPQATATIAARGERVIFLGADGETIKTMGFDGNPVEDLGVIDTPDAAIVVALIADPTGEHIIYGLGEEGNVATSYYLWREGQSKFLGNFIAPPRLSYDGKWLVGQLVNEENLPGAIYLVELATGAGRSLPESGLPDWFPDGKRLVIVRDAGIYAYDLERETSTPIIQFPNDDQNAWNVQEAHVLADGEGIVFFGSHYLQDGQLMIGASGNGQQWWLVPPDGGEPLPWREPEGSGVQAFAVSHASERLAYAYTAHSSACMSIQSINVVDARREAGQRFSPQVPELEPRENGAAYIRGLTWSPGGEYLEFGIQSYTCPAEGVSQEFGVPVIYLWDVMGGGAKKVAEGSFPNWVR
jgi:hypothetical protein